MYPNHAELNEIDVTDTTQALNSHPFVHVARTFPLCHLLVVHDGCIYVCVSLDTHLPGFLCIRPVFISFKPFRVPADQCSLLTFHWGPTTGQMAVYMRH